MLLLKPSEFIIIYPVLVDWQKQALETVIVCSFVAANVLGLVRGSIVPGGIRASEDPVGVLRDVQSAETLRKGGRRRFPRAVGIILSASSRPDAQPDHIEPRLPPHAVVLIFLTIPLCLWGVHPET
jgi:hypothetical protein